MSNHPPHHPPGPPRLPGSGSMGYPGSASFPPPPPPALNPGHSNHHYGSYPSHSSESIGNHHGPGNPGVDVSDLYRPSPIGPPSHTIAPLPSMRTIDALHPPPTMHHYSGPPNLPSGPLPFFSMPPPYGIPPHGLPSFGMHGQHGHVPDMRMPSFGMATMHRHKKAREIKRRTKTGCMTCRKRRIKCDETHPTCNNCKKSKRECAGYDPIFKQQPNNPAFLQPTAHVPPSTSAATVASTATGSANGAPPVPFTPTAAAAVAAAAAATASTASTLAAIKSPTTIGAPPSLSSASGGSTSSISSIYNSTGPPPSSSSSSYHTSSNTSFNPSGYSSRSIVSPPGHPGAAFDLSGAVFKAKMKIDEIIGQSGHSPPTPSAPPSRETVDEITKVYYEIYLPGLSAFFETSWYNFKPGGTTNPVSILLNNSALVSLLSSFLDSVAKVQTTDINSPAIVATSAQELRVVWSLASMAYVTPATVNLPGDEPVADDNAAEARNRLAVIDALFSGGCVRTNPCMPPPRSGDPNRIREHQFWWWLAEYLRLQEDAGLVSTPGNSLLRLREQALAQMRNLLDGRENRDVIYSIAILRDLAPRFPAGYDVAQPPHAPDETDPRSKFAVAARFIRNEAQDHGGTTNVVRRFAQLGIQAFIQPGYSVWRP